MLFCWILGFCLKTFCLSHHVLPTLEPSAILSFLRLAVVLLLQAIFRKVVVILAPPCSTWVAINAGTSRRSIVCPGGDPNLLQNRKSNKLAARTGLSLVNGAMFFILWPLKIDTRKKFSTVSRMGSDRNKSVYSTLFNIITWGIIMVYDKINGVWDMVEHSCWFNNPNFQNYNFRLSSLPGWGSCFSSLAAWMAIL